ncbi:hypothetical protein [Mycolicibacterium sp. XJ870]
MCGDAIQDAIVEPVANFMVQNPFVTDIVSSLAPGMLGHVLPLAVRALSDFSSIDPEDVKKSETRLDELKELSYETNPTGVTPEDFSNVTFEEVASKFTDATATCGVPEAWRDVSGKIIDATQNFNRTLATLERREGEDSWTGATHDAVIGNIESSFTEPDSASSGAAAMEILADAWAKTIGSIHANILANQETYQNDLAAHPEFVDDIKHDYDTFAQSVMQDVYAPNITDIANKNPAFTAGGPPEVGPQEPGGPQLPGGVGPMSNPGLTPPSFDRPKLPTTSAAGPKASDPGLSALTDPLRTVGDAARNAVGQAVDAAKKAAAAAQTPPDPKLGGPPEGVLGLGPKGLAGTSNAGGGGKTGAGAGALRGMPTARPVGLPSTASPKMAAPVAGAGLSNQSVPPGAGPAAGQRAGDNNSKGHQINKALRHKKNGNAVAGEAGAVVPVIGAKEPSEEAQNERSHQPDRPTDVEGPTKTPPRPVRPSPQPIPIPGQ